MPTQLSDGCGFDLSTLTGQLIAWRLDEPQPWLISIAGQFFVAVFPNEVSLAAWMKSEGLEAYRLKRIDDGPDFAASIHEAGCRLCFNVHRVSKKLRYTEIRMPSHSAWRNQATEDGSTVIAHAFVKSKKGTACHKCGWPKENHLAS